MRVRPAAITAFAAAALLLAACSTTAARPSGRGTLAPVTSSPTVTGTAGTGLPSGGPSTAPTTAAPHTSAPSTAPPTSHAYPSDYGQAILAAWAAHDTAYLTLLTSSATAGQMFSWGDINTHWSLLNGQGAAGSTYQTYDNTSGDYLVLRTINEQVAAHQWHAGSVQTWDQMKFPSDATDYAKEWVDGWIEGNTPRMNLLGTTALTTYVQAHFTTPSTGYTLTLNPSLNEVEVKDTATSLDMSVIIVASALGHHHAINGCDIGC